MYRNISYYTDPVDKQGMVILDTWDENGERVTKHLPAHSSLWYEDDRGTETSMFNTKLSHRVFPNNFERYNWIKGDRRKRYFECLPPTKEFLFNMYKGEQETPEFTKYDLRVFYTDIEIAVEDEFPESDEAKYPINVITIFDSLKRKYHIWHLNDKGITFEDEDDKEFYGFSSEFKMLNHFVDWFINNRPDVISGWNVLGFDMPYIINRVEKKCARSKEFSPVGKVRALEMKPKEKNYVIKYYSVEGLSILDQLILYRDKFVFKKQPQYTLDHIGDIELGVKKLEYEGSMRDLWKNNFEHWVRYNIRDVELCVKLEEKLNHISLARMMCNMGLCEYESIYKTSPYILGAIVLQGYKMGKKVVTKVENEIESAEFTGAYVFPTQAGVYHRGVFSVDLNSLYPNIMITLNMSPETKVGVIVEENDEHVVIRRADGKNQTIPVDKMQELLAHNLTKSANGVLYFKHHIKKGILPVFLERVYNDRQADRKRGFEFEVEADKLSKTLDSLRDDEYNTTKEHINKLEKDAQFLDTAQMARKILINSLYGSLGSIYFPLFDLDNAEAVTLTGQLINKSAAKFMTEYAKTNYNADCDVIIYGDTDSLYINAEPMVNKAIGDSEITDDNIDSICTELDGVCDLINGVMTDLCTNDLRSQYPTIEYKRECFASEGIFTAKKRYALHVRDDEGKSVDKFKYTGNEIKKSEIPAGIKVHLKYVYEKSLCDKWKSSKYASEIRRIWDEYEKLDIEDVATFKGYGSEKTMDGFLEASKGTGGHAKASLFYNQLLDDMDICGKYDKIRIGDKVRVCNISKNNKYGIDVIAWPAHGKYPKEFEDVFDIDRRVMFNKTVLSPLNIVIELNGWSNVDPCNDVEVDIMSI